MDEVFGRSSERGCYVDTQWLPSALGTASDLHMARIKE